MKKLIAILTLLLIFTISATAQTKPLTNDQAGKSDTAKLSELVQLTAEQQPLFENLFEIKHRLLNDNELPLGRKEDLVSAMGEKVKAILTEEQFNKLNTNPELLKNLIGANVIKVPLKK